MFCGISIVILVSISSCFCSHGSLRYGEEFYITFMNTAPTTGDTPSVTIYNPNNYAVDVSLECMVISYNVNVTVKAMTSTDVNISTSLFFDSLTDTTPYVLKVNTIDNTGSIAVKAMTKYSGNTQIYDVIPFTRYGKSYYVLMACPNLHYFLHLIWPDASFSGFVEVRLPSTYSGYVMFRYDNFDYRGGDVLSIFFDAALKAAIILSDYDLSGTEIVAHENIGVFVGCDYEINPKYYQTKQSVPSVLMPNEYSYYFRTGYFLTSITYTHSARIMKITEGTTNVTIDHDKCQEIALTDASPLFTLSLHDPIVEIRADNIIVVIHLIVDSLEPSVSFYYAVPDIQYDHIYQFGIPEVFHSLGYYLNATLHMDTNDSSDIIMNGSPLSTTWSRQYGRLITVVPLPNNSMEFININGNGISGIVEGFDEVTNRYFILPLVPPGNNIELGICSASDIINNVTTCDIVPPAKCHIPTTVGMTTSTLSLTTTSQDTSTSESLTVEDTTSSPTTSVISTTGEDMTTITSVSESGSGVSPEHTSPEDTTLTLSTTKHTTAEDTTSTTTTAGSGSGVSPENTTPEDTTLTESTPKHTTAEDTTSAATTADSGSGVSPDHTTPVVTTLTASTTKHTTAEDTTSTAMTVGSASGLAHMTTEDTTSVVTSSQPAIQSIPVTDDITTPCDCVCPDDEIHPVNMTEELIAQIEQIKRELTVDKSTLSSVIRSKTSAEDSRPSATYVGSIGIVLLTVIFGGLFVSDFTVLYTAFKKLVLCKPL